VSDSRANTHPEQLADEEQKAGPQMAKQQQIL
jgi:hypothetical protein